MARQFVAVQLGARTYTYHNDGPRVIAGDEVIVPTRGSGTMTAKVVSNTDVAPPFETKAIIGKAPRAQLDLGA